jgi:hypothetical protein
MVRGLLLLSAAVALTATASAGLAQSPYGAASDWNRSWGFRSPSSDSIALQRALAIRKAKNESPDTVVYNTTDNRSNYIENVSESGEITSTIDNSSDVGTNTNSVGSMNTGSTEISVDGGNNVVDATNSSSNTGCTDGSVSSAMVGLPSSGKGGDGGFSPFAALAGGTIASPQQNC